MWKSRAGKTAPLPVLIYGEKHGAGQRKEDGQGMERKEWVSWAQKERKVNLGNLERLPKSSGEEFLVGAMIFGRFKPKSIWL